MKYRNFDLEVSGYQQDEETERFRVRVVDSPAGQQRTENAEEVAIPPDLRRRARQLAKRRLDLAEMIALGRALGNCLFPPGARRLLMLSQAELDNGEGLRIRIRLNTYTLTDLPWEYVYLPRPDTLPGQEGIAGFLALDRRISLVRYELMEQRLERLDPVGTSPLRLVVLMADPNTSIYPKLHLDAERRNIKEALEDVPAVQPEFYPDATVEAVLDAVTREAHIFHFAGHGEFEGQLGVTLGSVEGRGSIVLVNDDGEPLRFPADRLAQTLLGRGIRLAVLGACQGGTRDRVNAWTGVAPALTRAGIPAVVGMQFTVGDRNAIAFSRQFYRSLAAGQPIDAAVTDGRLAIHNRSDQDERDWGVPVLYLRSEEGVLFPSPEVEERGPSAAERIELPQIEPATDHIDQRVLRMAMVNFFSLEELEAICADVEHALDEAGIRIMGRPIPVSLEMVGGRSKQGKVLNLIQYLDRRGYLGYLVNVVRLHKPGVI
jgi:hypothetical protein